MKNYLFLIFATIMLISFNSCQKPDLLDKERGEQTETLKTMNDLVVGNEFDWKTTKDVQLKLTGETNGVVYINTIDGDNYHKALLISESEYVTKITVPSYVKELVLSYNGQSNTVAIDNSTVEYYFN